MSRRMRKIFFGRISDRVERRVDNYEGKPVPDDWVASRGRKSIDSVGSGSGSVQHDSKLSRMPCQILSIE